MSAARCEHKRILHDGTPKRRLVSCKDCGCKMGWHKGDWVGISRGSSSATETDDVDADGGDAAEET